MSLLGQNNQYSDKENRNITLAELGGGAAGAGAGLLASLPVDAAYHKRLFNQAKSMSEDKTVSKQNWSTLLKLFKGELAIEDLPESQRVFFLKQLEENAEDLEYLANNPSDAKRSLQELDRGKVEPLFSGKQKSRINGLFHRVPETLPENVVPMYAGGVDGIFSHKIRSPISKTLPGVVGLGGMIGAGAAMRKHYDKEKTDPMDEIREQIRALQERVNNQ